MAIAREQSAGYCSPNTTDTDITLTFGSAPDEDNLIVLFTGGGDGAEGITWPSGFTQIVKQGVAGQYDLRAAAYKVAGASEGTTYQCTFSDTTGMTFWISGYEISGQATSNPIDVYAGDVTNSNCTEQSTGTTGTTAQADEMALATVCAWMSQDDTASWDNSFTADVDLYVTGGYNIALWTSYKTLSATGTQESTASWTGTASDAHGIIVTVKEASATPQSIIYPIADTAATGWDTAPTASQDLYLQIDEVTASDTDYIYAEDPNP